MPNRSSVTSVICGETREPIDFIFCIYLPLDNSNPHSRGPLLSQGGVVRPDVLGSVGARPRSIAIKFGPNMSLMSLGKGNTLAKFWHPDRGVRAPKVSLGPNFGNGYGLWPNGWTDLVQYWHRDSPWTWQIPMKISLPLPIRVGVMEVPILATLHLNGKIACRVHPHVYCDETRESIEFIFSRYLPQDNNNPTLEVVPSL